jgi:hypothetical protein
MSDTTPAPRVYAPRRQPTRFSRQDVARLEAESDLWRSEIELRPLPRGFRLAVLESPPPFVDPDLLSLDD